MTLTEVKDWLANLFEATYYVGVLDAKKPKSVGVYQLHRSTDSQQHVGGGARTKTKGVSLLVHWEQDSGTTEQAGRALYEAIQAHYRGQTIGTYPVSYVKLLNREPLDVGQDANGIFERVIELEIYY